jgi:hypothetical protein
MNKLAIAALVGLTLSGLGAAAPGAKHFIMFDDPAGFDAAADGFLKR